jgi:hypothetical protein
MNRRYWMLPVLFLSISSLVIYGATCANEVKKSENTSSSDPAITIQKLLERIESLEKRISKLENGETLVRVADRREESAVGTQQQSPQQKETNSDSERSTNGQTWRLRLLNHRN